MVEAAVVLPVLVLFYGLTTYIHAAYLEKNRIQAETRFAAFSSAAYGCSEGGGAGGQRGLDVEVPAEGDAPDADKDVSVESSFLKTTGNKTAVATAAGRKRTVTAFSTVYCNPRTSALGGGAASGLGKMKSFFEHGVRSIARWARGLIGGN